MNRAEVMDLFWRERQRQAEIWSLEHDWNHTDFEWLTIANKKMGKIAEAILDGEDCAGELVKFGAVLMGWLEMKEVHYD